MPASSSANIIANGNLIANIVLSNYLRARISSDGNLLNPALSYFVHDFGDITGM
ncbi:hypothetical protein D3C83_303280 [compost metagenome]